MLKNIYFIRLFSYFSTTVNACTNGIYLFLLLIKGQSLAGVFFLFLMVHNQYFDLFIDARLYLFTIHNSSIYIVSLQIIVLTNLSLLNK